MLHARDRNFSRQKSGIVALFISQKRRKAFAVEFSHPGVLYEEEETLGFRNPSYKKIFDAPCIPLHPFDPSSSGSVLREKAFHRNESKRA